MTVHRRPPRLAEWILVAILPRDSRDALIADLADAYAHPSRRHRDRWYWGQVVRACWPPTIVTLHLQQRHRELRAGNALRRQPQGGFVKDVAYAVRSLRRAPGFTVSAV